MRIMSFSLLFIFCMLAGLTLAYPYMPGIRGGEQPPLVMGVFPRRHYEITKEIFDPMARLLKKRLGRRVILKTSKDFKSFWESVKNKEFDLVHYNQYHYLLSKSLGYEVIARNEERGKSTITGSLIVRKDSNILSIQDLKGKRILFGGGPKAMQSYIYATYLLRQGGLKEGDYEISFAANPPSAIVNAFFKLRDVSAAGAGDVVLDLPIIKRQIDPQQMRILSKGEHFAHLPWAVRSNLDPDLKAKIQKTLLSMKSTPEGKKALRKARLTNLVKAADSDFDPHRRIVREVLGEVY